jgi:hypothetical protein
MRHYETIKEVNETMRILAKLKNNKIIDITYQTLETVNLIKDLIVSIEFIKGGVINEAGIESI